MKTGNGRMGEGSRTEVETPYVLEALAAIAISSDDHDPLKIGLVISARQGSLVPGYRDLLPTHPIERTADA